MASWYLAAPLNMLIAHLTYTDQNRVPCDAVSMVAPWVCTMSRAYMQITAMIASITAALAFMEGCACPVDERHWLKQLRELQGDVAAAAAAPSWQTMR